MGIVFTREGPPLTPLDAYGQQMLPFRFSSLTRKEMEVTAPGSTAVTFTFFKPSVFSSRWQLFAGQLHVAPDGTALSRPCSRWSPEGGLSMA